MEIKLSAGDKIQIPTGCKATIENDFIVIKKKQEEFKDGDILSIATRCGKTMPFIYKGVDERGFYEFYVGINYIGDVFVCPDDDARWGCDKPVHATEDEKQRLLDKLKEQGLLWNAEAKQMEKIRKRAEKGNCYLCVDTLRGKVLDLWENEDGFDDNMFNSGNYYLPEEREQAEADAKAIKAIFEKRLKV